MYAYLAQFYLKEWLLTDEFNLSCAHLHMCHERIYQKGLKSLLMALNEPLKLCQLMLHWWTCGSQPNQWALRWYKGL